MIDFSDVRIEKEPTYLFMTNLNKNYVCWAFEDAGIADYRIESLKKIRDQIPEHVVIPDSVPLVIYYPEGRACRNPVVLITHMNTDDLLKKLIQACLLDDPDIRRRVEQIEEEALQDYLQNYQHLEGLIPIRSV